MSNCPPGPRMEAGSPSPPGSTVRTIDSTPADIFVINADGSNLAQITTDPHGDFDPAWSPDGKQIAFVSDRNANNDSNYEIYLINADGTGEMRLTNNHYTDRWPCLARTTARRRTHRCLPARLSLLADVTIPPGTRFVQSQDFTKVWRVQNTGTCTWTPTAYSLRSVGVDNLAGPVQIDAPRRDPAGRDRRPCSFAHRSRDARHAWRRLAGGGQRGPAGLCPRWHPLQHARVH